MVYRKGLKMNKSGAVLAAAGVGLMVLLSGIPVSALTEEGEYALNDAAFYAMQYDYDRAMDRIREVEGYDQDGELSQAIASYQEQKDACIDYPLEEITHVFFHTLVVDPEKAFDGDTKTAGYNQVMTTVDEFRRIIQSMYDRGYVLVSPHDMASLDENGVMQRRSILVPEGKIPFVLSQDDVSYYHYMDGDGFATRLVLDENGQEKNKRPASSGNKSKGTFSGFMKALFAPAPPPKRFLSYFEGMSDPPDAKP